MIHDTAMLLQDAANQATDTAKEIPLAKGAPFSDVAFTRLICILFTMNNNTVWYE